MQRVEKPAFSRTATRLPISAPQKSQMRWLDVLRRLSTSCSSGILTSSPVNDFLPILEGGPDYGPAENMRKRLYIITVVRSFLVLICVLVLTLLPAGRWDYWQGWALAIASVLITVAKSVLFADKKDLAKERRHPGPGTKWWDKVFYTLYLPAYLAILVVSGLDAGRFRWSPSLHWALYAAGWCAFVAGTLLSTWAAWVNRFFSSVVRIQTDRGHHVIQDGPYRQVRHPGYVGVMQFAPGTAIILGSLWGLVPAAITIILLVIRAYLEDTTLQRELSGYAEYATKTRYRLLPGLW